jgi:hypothetical protein
MYVLRGKPRLPLEVPHLDGLDQCGYNGVVQARVLEVRELVHGGAFIEAVGMLGGWGG